MYIFKTYTYIIPQFQLEWWSLFLWGLTSLLIKELTSGESWHIKIIIKSINLQMKYPTFRWKMASESVCLAEAYKCWYISQHNRIGIGSSINAFRQFKTSSYLVIMTLIIFWILTLNFQINQCFITMPFLAISFIISHLNGNFFLKI